MSICFGSYCIIMDVENKKMENNSKLFAKFVNENYEAIDSYYIADNGNGVYLFKGQDIISYKINNDSITKMNCDFLVLTNKKKYYGEINKEYLCIYSSNMDNTNIKQIGSLKINTSQLEYVYGFDDKIYICRNNYLVCFFDLSNECFSTEYDLDREAFTDYYYNNVVKYSVVKLDTDLRHDLSNLMIEKDSEFAYANLNTLGDIAKGIHDIRLKYKWIINYSNYSFLVFDNQSGKTLRLILRYDWNNGYIELAGCYYSSYYKHDTCPYIAPVLEDFKDEQEVKTF